MITDVQNKLISARQKHNNESLFFQKPKGISAVLSSESTTPQTTATTTESTTDTTPWETTLPLTSAATESTTADQTTSDVVLTCENGGVWDGSVCVCPLIYAGLLCDRYPRGKSFFILSLACQCHVHHEDACAEGPYFNHYLTALVVPVKVHSCRMFSSTSIHLKGLFFFSILLRHHLCRHARTFLAFVHTARARIALQLGATHFVQSRFAHFFFLSAPCLSFTSFVSFVATIQCDQL